MAPRDCRHVRWRVIVLAAERKTLAHAAGVVDITRPDQRDGDHARPRQRLGEFDVVGRGPAVRNIAMDDNHESGRRAGAFRPERRCGKA
jgi:hypothetical protein